jgi:DNA-binding response OmpR family regulator
MTMAAKVLLIDDEPQLLSLMVGAFRGAGFETIAASNGRAGVKMFRLERPQLVVTDIVMPEQEGIGTLLELKRCADPPKVIAISGSGRLKVDYLEWATQLGADAVLPKPFRLSTLLATARSVLGLAPCDCSDIPSTPTP